MFESKAIKYNYLEDVQEFETGVEKYGKMFRMNVIFRKRDIFLDDFGHSFETRGWIFLQKIICAKSYLEGMY